MTVVELRYQRFGLYADIVFTNISVDGDPRREILFDDADVRNELFIGTFGGASELARASSEPRRR